MYKQVFSLYIFCFLRAFGIYLYYFEKISLKSEKKDCQNITYMVKYGRNKNWRLFLWRKHKKFC